MFILIITFEFLCWLVCLSCSGGSLIWRGHLLLVENALAKISQVNHVILSSNHWTPLQSLHWSCWAIIKAWSPLSAPCWSEVHTFFTHAATHELVTSFLWAASSRPKRFLSKHRRVDWWLNEFTHNFSSKERLLLYAIPTDGIPPKLVLFFIPVYLSAWLSC